MRGDESIQEKDDPFSTPDNETPGVPSGGENPPLDPEMTAKRALYFDWDFVLCPRCNRHRNGYPALSRVDNQTYICSLCGTDEAMTNMADHSLAHPDVWPLELWSSSSDVIEEVNQQ